MLTAVDRSNSHQHVRSVSSQITRWLVVTVISRGANARRQFNLPSQLAYDNASEVTTVQALDELIMDPDEMRTQALLVRERILGPDHPDTTYFIRYRGAVYADMGNFDRFELALLYLRVRPC